MMKESSCLPGFPLLGVVEDFYVGDLGRGSISHTLLLARRYHIDSGISCYRSCSPTFVLTVYEVHAPLAPRLPGLAERDTCISPSLQTTSLPADLFTVNISGVASASADQTLQKRDSHDYFVHICWYRAYPRLLAYCRTLLRE
jgi:hypothetical protein